MSKQLQVLVVDDTITYRTILKKAVSGIPGAEVVGVAPNGEIALDKIRQLHPNLVLMDIEMPEMDGLEALSRIRELYPSVGVVMVSGTNRSSVESTIRALELGALDFIRKPDGLHPEDNTDYIRRHLAGVFAGFDPVSTSERTSREAARGGSDGAGSDAGAANLGPFSLVAVGCSTGGPTALMKLIPVLPADFPVPIVIVQHMPAGFTESLARNLNAKSALTVSEVEHEEVLLAGHVYLAPGGRHVSLRSRRNGPIFETHACLHDSKAVNNCRPSVDVLFSSLAEKFKGDVLAAVLTGMGSDGVRGLAELKKRGRCYCITQNEASCVVYGMPRAVEQARLSDSSLPLEAIAIKISNLVAESRRADATV